MQGKKTNLTRVLLAKIYKRALGPVLLVIALFIGLVAVNYVAAVKAPGFDISREKVNSLSQGTLNLLDGIDYNISVKVFFLSSNQRRVEKLFEKYTERNSRIKVEFIDPLKKPVIAEEYEVSIPGTIVFETAGKKSRLNPNPSGRPFTEREITLALYRLMSQDTKKAYFTTGHGELSLANVKRDGLSTIQERLTEQNYVVEPLTLLGGGNIPADCSVLVIAAPTIAFTQEEIEMILQYTDIGGSVFLMLGPGSESGLEIIPGAFGIMAGNDYVYETARNMTTQGGGAVAPLCSAQDTCEITNALPNQTFMFPFTRSMFGRTRVKTLRMWRVAASSPDSWAETDIASARTANTVMKPSRDEKELRGPVTVAMIVERDVDLPDSLATNEHPTFASRSAFFGTGTFITNEVVTLFPQNLNLFLNTMNWMTKNEKIIEITPNAVAFTPIELKNSERRAITWITLVLIPFAIIMAGIVVWYRRR